MHFSSASSATIVLTHLAVLSSLAAPAPPKKYMNKKTHHEGKHDIIHLSKGKVGDNQVLHALLNDPNVGDVHQVFTAIDDPVAAHKNLQHYLDRHIGDTDRVHVYKTPNHLHEVEHHESIFDTVNEDKTPVKTKGPLLDFEKDLGSTLQKGHQTIVHSTAPTSLWHLKHIAKVTSANGNSLSHINLSVGHNSQQYNADPDEKLPTEGRFLTKAQKKVRKYHPATQVRFTNSRMTFKKSKKSSVNVPADATVDLLHPTTQKQAKQDIFFGPTIEKVHEHLHQFKEKGAIRSDTHIPDPHPPVFKDANINLRGAVHEMLTTKDKEGVDLERIKEGRPHFEKFLHAAPGAMRQALKSGMLPPKDLRGTKKRLERIDTDSFRANFKGDGPYPVEMGDPNALAAHRQAFHNKDDEDGPKYKPVHFRLDDNRWIGEEAKAGQEVHGMGVFGADPEETFEDHRNIITNGKDVGYIKGSGQYPKDDKKAHDHASSSHQHQHKP